LASFKANHRKAFNGLALAIISSGKTSSTLQLRASSAGLRDASVTIQVK
jgi:beta-galactosidase